MRLETREEFSFPTKLLTEVVAQSQHQLTPHIHHQVILTDLLISLFLYLSFCDYVLSFDFEKSEVGDFLSLHSLEAEFEIILPKIKFISSIRYFIVNLRQIFILNMKFSVSCE
jgi:hypothetical protein